jgi:hypothetical protein
MPTLGRLHASDRDEYRQTALDSIRIALLLGALIATGKSSCSQNPVGSCIRERFVRRRQPVILSVYVLIVFVNIALSTIIISAGRTLTWS